MKSNVNIAVAAAAAAGVLDLPACFLEAINAMAKQVLDPDLLDREVEDIDLPDLERGDEAQPGPRCGSSPRRAQLPPLPAGSFGF